MQPGKEFRSGLMVDGIGCAGVNVERNTKVFERLFDDAMIFIHYLLWGNAFFSGLDGDGHPMFVGTSDKYDFLAPGAQITGINIGRHVDTGQVANVNGSVGIGQG
mgnify:CR=1 FL=1